MGKILKKWSEEDIATLQSLLKEGKSINYISHVFERTENNIRARMSQLGISVRTLQKHEQGSGRPSDFAIGKYATEDLATRIRILKGEEIRKTKARCYFTDSQIEPWLEGIKGLDLFVKEVLDVELQDYQLEIINKMLNHKRFVGVMGRQSGKDWLVSCFVIWQCITNSNQKILLVSAGQRQSDLLYNRILSFIGRSRELFDSVDKSNMERCIFKNNSEIWSLPATGFIRGFTEVTHVIINEAFEVPDFTFSAIEPMLAITNGYEYLFSTPRGCIGRLWECFNNPYFAKVQLPSSVNKYISEEFLEEQKKTMDALEYDMEFNAQFQQSVDTFFKLDTINDCSYEYSLRHTPEQGKEYYCGIDWGRTHDESVVTIISKIVSKEEVVYKVENIIEMSKVEFPEQVRRVISLQKSFHFIKIVPEWAGLGIPPCDDLTEQLGNIVKVFVPTIDNKAEGYNKLRKLMEDKKLIIPKSHTNLQFELRTFQYEITATGKTKLFHLAKSSDDRIDSLMFAVNGAVMEQPYLPFIC